MSSEPQSPSPRSRPGRRLVKMLAGLLLTVGLMEVGAWIVLRRDLQGRSMEGRLGLVSQALGGLGNRTPEISPSIRQQYIHPYLGFLPEARGRTYGDSVTFVWQPQAFQEDSPLFSTRPEDLVVVVAGGSVAAQFGFGPGAQLLIERLREIPRFAGREPRLFFLAAGGLKQPQQLTGLNWLLSMGARVDMMICLDGFNEIALHHGENHEFGVALSYPRAWYPRVQALTEGNEVGEHRYLTSVRRDLARDYRDSSVRWSNLRSLWWIWRDKGLARRQRSSKLEFADSASRKWHPTLHGPRDPIKRLQPRQLELVKIWERSSLLIDQICDARGIEFFVFLQPNQYVDGSKPMKPAERATAVAQGGYGRLVRSTYPALQQAGAQLLEQGLRFADLTGVFREQFDPIYTDTCCHVNDLGNRMIAEAMTEFIASW